MYSGIEYISVADKTVPDIGLRFDIPLLSALRPN